MKTHTEISGHPLREAYKIRTELLRIKKEELRTRPPKAAAKPEPEVSAAPSEPEGEKQELTPTPEGEKPEIESKPEAAAETSALETTEPDIEKALEAETSPPTEPSVDRQENQELSPTTETPPEEEEKVEANPEASEESEEHIKTPDERWEELQERRRQEQARRRQEWLDLLGEIKEPFSAKLQEKYAWREEKLPLVMNALEVIDRKRLADLRRVVVFKPEKEDEPLPKHGRKIEDYVYVAEYLFRPPPPEKKRDPRDRKKGRGKGKGKGRGKGRSQGDGRGRGQGQGPSEGRGRGRSQAQAEGRGKNPQEKRGFRSRSGGRGDQKKPVPVEKRDGGTNLPRGPRKPPRNPAP